MKSILAMSESMQVHLKNLTTFDSARVEYFDLHEEFGFSSIVKMDETIELDLNGAVIRSWPKADQPEIWWIKWFDADHVVLNLHGPEVAIVSAESWERHHLGRLSGLYLSPKFMLATYGEEQFHGSRPGEFEGNVISVFLRKGAFEFGIQEVMDKDRDSWQFDEVQAGYIFDNKFAFIAYASELFWVLDVSKKSWRKFPAPVALWSAHVLSGDSEKAYGIFDNRWFRDPDRPLFELAVFDLVAETAWMQDIAPVENALFAAGFSMSEIKLQPSSTGKIIVSDGKKAALLEFSD
jgi:hypothetical protein